MAIPNYDWSKLKQNGMLFSSGFQNEVTPLDDYILNQVLRAILNNKDSIDSNAIESEKKDALLDQTISNLSGMDATDIPADYQNSNEKLRESINELINNTLVNIVKEINSNIDNTKSEINSSISTINSSLEDLDKKDKELEDKDNELSSAIELKSPIDSPQFTGAPQAPTPDLSTSTTSPSIANVEFVHKLIHKLLDDITVIKIDGGNAEEAELEAVSGA